MRARDRSGRERSQWLNGFGLEHGADGGFACLDRSHDFAALGLDLSDCAALFQRADAFEEVVEGDVVAGLSTFSAVGKRDGHDPVLGLNNDQGAPTPIVVSPSKLILEDARQWLHPLSLLPLVLVIGTVGIFPGLAAFSQRED